MWKGHQKEEWDKIAMLRAQMMATCLSPPKQMPSIGELNPYRKEEEVNDWDDFDGLEKDIVKALR